MVFWKYAAHLQENIHDKVRSQQSCFSNFIEIALWHGCSPVNLLHIFRTPFPRNTSGCCFWSHYIIVWEKKSLETSWIAKWGVRERLRIHICWLRCCFLWYHGYIKIVRIICKPRIDISLNKERTDIFMVIYYKILFKEQWLRS